MHHKNDHIGRFYDGGEAGIRTLDTLTGILDFESSSFDHSDTSPSTFFFPGKNTVLFLTRTVRSDQRNKRMLARSAGKKSTMFLPTPPHPIVGRQEGQAAPLLDLQGQGLVHLRVSLYQGDRPHPIHLPSWKDCRWLQVTR